ncbi:preprotein translocase subunit YajC [Nocardioides sp. Kera G14]|uniref:preprotein translocase subunit YajC n=1 Tax=Nocardioides sp. Kera G14 TaxID=2884264 RepID=UPI001D0FD3BA|nr:preprotein translocase subunit YajC [Nocardioides sp. Kera G14]UDY22179.1 preprotein translocase subunit YajC [Nocardioides sp. Kera G14]
MSQIGEFLPFIVILLVFWLLIIRPQRRRQAEARALQEAAGPGAHVVLTSGIFGTIVERTDDFVVVQIADGVHIKVAKAAIGHILPAETARDDASEIPEAGATHDGVDLDKEN